jgi:polysaccharide biosynthesis/export protein
LETQTTVMHHLNCPQADPLRANFIRQFASLTFVFLLAGCTQLKPHLASAGPQTAEIERVASNIQLQLITPELVANLHSLKAPDGAFMQLTPVLAQQRRVAIGDTLDISVWESPPAVLFNSALDARSTTGAVAARGVSLPEYVVDAGGDINVPHIGRVAVTGRTPADIESDIARRLRGKANQPTVVVRIAKFLPDTVTIIGDVASGARFPLSAKRERILDALAAAGGVKHPVDKIMVQVSRSKQTIAMPLSEVLRNPLQNVELAPDDVVAVRHQPFNLSVLGASGKNDELAFEAVGINLAQALARSGGLNDSRADSKGVFIFRQTALDVVPTVYQLDLSKPEALFLAQRFPMRDKDVIYVANASSSELQKFLNLVASVLTPALTVRGLTN